MVYDPEKYREKRDRVLGIKKRGLGFGTLAVIVSVFILAGLGTVTVPQVVSYLSTRHLDDVIFKLESADAWPQTVVADVRKIKGVAEIIEDKNHTRLVVTYDNRTSALSEITAEFSGKNMNVTLLNQVNHRQHQTTLEKEAELEAP